MFFLLESSLPFGFQMATRRFYIAVKQTIKFLSQPINPKKDSCKDAFTGLSVETDLMQFLMYNDSGISPFQSISTMHLSHVSYANGTITRFF